jgi:hypothetical protein
MRYAFDAISHRQRFWAAGTQHHEARRCCKLLKTDAERPHEVTFYLLSRARIFNCAKIRPRFNSDRDVVAITLPHFIPCHDVYDKRHLFENLIRDNDLRYLQIDNVFVSILGNGCRADFTGDLFPAHLLRSVLNEVQIGFFVPYSGSYEKVKNDSTTIYLDKIWVLASGEGLKDILKLVKHFVTLYCRERDRKHVPAIASIR